MPTKREAAHVAAGRGFNVFPIVPNAKNPLIENWQNLATQDPKQIDAWWAEWPDANIGGSTNELVVIDVDPRHEGDKTFELVAAVEEFPKTTRSSTQGGGDHIIYAAPHPVKGGNNKLGKGVDIKARGGYILLPGSTIDGRPYAWGNDRPINRAPQWLLDQCAAVHQRPDSAGKRIVEEDEIAIELATQWMLKHAPTAEYGKIDDTTYAVAARLYDFGVALDTVIDLVSEWNDIKCHPPGDAERLLTVCESAGVNRDNAVGSRHPLAPGFDAYEIDERKAPPKPLADEKRPRLYVLRADEAARIALERRGEPLIQGIIDRGTMSVLVGKGGGGKTFLALDWSYHVAKGREWAGKRVKQGAVVYLAAEAGNMILSRLKALETHYGALGDAPLYVIPCPANFSRGPEDVKAILALIRDVEQQSGQKVEMFVVDTLARVMTGDENSAKDMGVILESVDFIRSQVGCHAMLIHHPNKAGTSARGSGNVFGGTDTEMWVDNKVVTFTKQRDLPLGSDIKFKLDTITIGAGDGGAAITSCVVRVSKPGEPEPKGDLTPNLSEVWTTLCAALGDAGKTEFDMSFLRTIPFRQASVKPLGRMTIHNWMTDLTEAGYLRKTLRGPWVRANDGTDGFDDNTQCHLTTDSPTPERRGTVKTQIRQERKRAKRKAK